MSSESSPLIKHFLPSQASCKPRHTGLLLLLFLSPPLSTWFPCLFTTHKWQFLLYILGLVFVVTIKDWLHIYNNNNGRGILFIPHYFVLYSVINFLNFLSHLVKQRTLSNLLKQLFHRRPTRSNDSQYCYVFIDPRTKSVLACECCVCVPMHPHRVEKHELGRGMIRLLGFKENIFRFYLEHILLKLQQTL